MFEKGDCVVYGDTGVCRVLNIGMPENIGRLDPARLYYTLAPVFQQGIIIYVPVNTKTAIRPVIAREKAGDLIGRITDIRESSYQCRDQKLLAGHYRSFLETHRCEDLIRLIKTIFHRRQESLQKGKKPRQVDEHYFRRAKELLYGELAVSLGIELEEVEKYISQKLSSES
ncbi:MAG: CarD family transcriptional regulator [Oscillospiraceae bacterium]|nr:CarD family transcriptional regulator [Oscillospiraceae bacterium]